MRHSKARSQASAIFKKERFLLDEFQMANFKISTSVHDNNMRWTPPMIPWFKLNVDGATFAHLDSGFWAIIRDRAGRVDAALSVRTLRYTSGTIGNQCQGHGDGGGSALRLGRRNPRLCCGERFDDCY